MVKIKIKKLHPEASVPKQATEFAGGWDVKCTNIIQNEPNFVICELGFALEVPVGYKVTLVPRSSFTKTNWILQNSPGLGDCDYRGMYQYRFRAIPTAVNNEKLIYDEFPYKYLDAIGQIYIEEIIPIEFEVVDTLTETVRGDGGFGSTTK